MAFDLATVKAWIGLPAAADAVVDPQISELMARALDAVQHELDWYFGASRPAVEILDGTGTRALWLRQPPLSGVAVYERAGVGAAWTLVSAADYEASGDTSQPMTAMGRALFNVVNWTAGVRNYKANYDEGFTTMPGDIEQLLLDLVKGKWQGRGAIPGMKSETIGDYAYTRGDLEETQGWFSVVARWKRGRI